MALSNPALITAPTMPRPRAWALATALLLAVLLLPVVAAPAEASGLQTRSDFEAQFLDLLNSERVERGLAPLKASSNARAVARDWSQQMGGGVGLAHRPGLSAPFTGSWTRLGENVGYGGTVSRLHQAFMDSSGHRANVLNSSFTWVGVGSVVSDRGVIWVTFNFGAGSDAVDTKFTKATTTKASSTDRADSRVLYDRGTGLLVHRATTANGDLGAEISRAGLSKGWDIVVAGDWNANGIDGLTFYRRTDGLLQTYAGAASGTIGARLFQGNISRNWDTITAGDWNANGTDGLTFYRRTDGLLQTYAGATSGTIGARLFQGNISRNWDIITAGDWNANGIDGLTFYRQTDGLFMVYSGRTTGSLGSQTVATTRHMNSTGLAAHSTG